MISMASLYFSPPGGWPRRSRAFSCVLFLPPPFILAPHWWGVCAPRSQEGEGMTVTVSLVLFSRLRTQRCLLGLN